MGQPEVMCTTFSPVNRIVIWNQCVAASLRQSFVVHITEILPVRQTAARRAFGPDKKNDFGWPRMGSDCD